MSTQAYDKDGNKIPFAVYKSDIVRGFQTVEQYEAQIASLTAENQRLRKVMRLLKEDARERHEDWIEYGCDQKDAIRFVGDVCGILRAALQPKKGNP